MSQSIPPSAYDRGYFLSETCEGYDAFVDGRGVSLTKAKQVRLLDPRPGLRVLDAGCGRGEVLLACARAGAEVAGIDYSEAAVELTRETLADVPGADVRAGDVTALPWPDSTFDRVLFADVIEHLDPPQTVPALHELRRILRPGGRLVVHTAPNLLFMRYGWPAVRPILRLAGKREAAAALDAWFERGTEYHVNEQSVHSLRRALREAGFADPRVWIDRDVLRQGEHHLTKSLDGPALRLAARVAALRPARAFLGNDVLALARTRSDFAP